MARRTWRRRGIGCVGSCVLPSPARSGCEEFRSSTRSTAGSRCAGPGSKKEETTDVSPTPPDGLSGRERETNHDGRAGRDVSRLVLTEPVVDPLFELVDLLVGRVPSDLDRHVFKHGSTSSDCSRRRTSSSVSCCGFRSSYRRNVPFVMSMLNRTESGAEKEQSQVSAETSSQ